MKRPLFSICIPNYNYASYIHETIQSVLQQTCEDFEIIVADNASTDNSVDMVRQFSDPRISLLINHYNIGFAPNLDRATEKARGEYIILLSSDDLMVPTALEKYAELIYQYRQEKGPSATPDRLILFSAIAMIDADGKILDSRPARPWNVSDQTKLQPINRSGTAYWYSGLDILSNQIRHLHCVGRFATTCVSREIYEKVCGYRTAHTIDPDTYYAYKCLSLNPVAVYLEEYLFHYRVHNQNQGSKEKKLAAPKLFIDRYYYTIEFDQDFYSKAGVTRNDIIDVFLCETCGQSALYDALNKKPGRAWQAFCIALATYPRQYFKNRYPYLLLLTLLSGPIAPSIFQMVKRLRKYFPASAKPKRIKV